MTYLDLVNSVLLRLRENSVSTVSQTQYSRLIGQFVNDAKRAVEDAWPWDCLQTTITLNLIAGQEEYTLTGSGRRFNRDITVNDTTSQARVTNAPARWIDDQYQLSTVQNGSPIYYAFAGTDGTDAKVKFFPKPDSAYVVKFNLVVPQADLSGDSDILTINSEGVIMGAYARALAERGEDGGLASSEAYEVYRSIVADQIALESNMFVENSVWVAD